MASGAIVFEGKENKRSMDCASGVAISKGTILQLTDPRTVSAATAAAQPCGGVASQDKSATDYATTIAAYYDGLVKSYASGSIVVGDPLQIALGANYVAVAGSSAVASGASIIGYSLETVSDEELFRWRLKL